MRNRFYSFESTASVPFQRTILFKRKSSINIDFLMILRFRYSNLMTFWSVTLSFSCCRLAFVSSFEGKLSTCPLFILSSKLSGEC